jgi:glycosyltransferase involved in cell wall biosynthesis
LFNAIVVYMIQAKKRLAIIVSHPVQYYAPLYPRLARRNDIAVKVFFTWHAGQAAVDDRGFTTPVMWDVPLTEGYEFELVPNVSANPGTHHFLGLRNPSLVGQVLSWRPDVVHITGWAWISHFLALRAFSKRGTPTLFRGDSHLLDHVPCGPHWWIKRALLKHVYSWPTSFLVVGSANRAYYEAFGVKSDRLFPCPHSIDVDRFANPANVFEQKAAQWRNELGIAGDQRVVLFAGKFERKKQPLELMRAVQALRKPQPVLVMVGSGELEAEVNALAATNPERFRVLPFQNQSLMPVVYRLGDLFVLPSSFAETWGLAVNEALACGRPVLASDRVGCAADLVDPSCGRVFSQADPCALMVALSEMIGDPNRLAKMGQLATERARLFDVSRTETALISWMLRVSSE